MTKGTLAGWQEMRCDDEGGGRRIPRSLHLGRALRKFLLAVVATGVGACADTVDKSEGLAGTELATAALALTGTGISAQLALTADWNEGYVAQITITNPTDVATSTWQLDLQLNDSQVVPTPWNGTLSGTSGRVMVTPAPYNHTIYPYSSIVVGFQAIKTGPSYEPTVLGVTRDGATGAGGSGSGQGGSGSSGTAGTGEISGASGEHDGGDGGAAGEGDAGGTPSTPSAGAGGSGASPTNIALDRPSTASSAQSGHAAHDGNDGSDDTRWCAASGASPEWWQVDLEGLYALSGSRITWEFSGRPYGYTLSVSQDGLDFTEVVDKRGYLGTEQVRADTFEATARYVRLTVTDLVSNPVTWASMKELEIYGSPLASGGGGAPGSGGTAGDAAGTGAGATSSTGAVTGEGGSTPGSGGSATESGGAAGTSGSGGAAGSTSDTEVEFFFKLPAWVRREQVVFATTGGDLRLNDGVKSGLADVSSVDGGKVSRLGVEATVGNLWSDGPVVLANRAVVHGSATSGSTIEVAPEAHIGGDRREHHDLGGLARVAWTVQFPATSGPTEFLQPGESRALPPGHYPHIVVNQNAHLQLTSGTYTFEGLTVEAGGFIDIDNTAQMVLLYVKNDMTFRGAMTRIVDRANVLFGLAGSGTQIVGGAFRGLLVAPYGTVVMGSDNDGHRGSFFAKAIEAHQWTPISHEPWTHDGLCGANAPCSALCPCEIGDSGCTDETDCVEGASCGTDGVCECADRCDDHGCADASRNRCGEYCPSRCDLGEPGCRADADCSEGTICGLGVGERFGFSDEENVCWTFECSIHDPAHPSDAELNQDCGILPACTPRCDAGDTGPDGCGSFCGDCSSGEIRGPAGRCIAAEASMLRYSPSGAPASSREPGTTVESGAVSGKFAVNDRGQATYAIPIEVPPGVKGVQPTLGLMYTSNKTDGILGMGWSLAGISTISRCQQILDRDGQMDPVRLTDTDRLCLDGKEISELQETDPSIRLTETYHGFTLESGNGRVTYYEPVLEVFLENRSETVPRLWGVTRVVDHGNTIDIAYRTPVSTGTTLEGANDAELLPESITYANAYSSVTFEYEPRNAPLIRWVSGVRTISMSRLKAINTFVGTVPVKRIEISYFDWGSALPNLVEAITECAFDELGTKICKDAPTKFDYNERIGPGEVIGEQEVSVDAYPRLTDYGESRGVWASPVFYVGDFDGDGDQDAVFEGAELWNEDGASRLVPHNGVAPLEQPNGSYGEGGSVLTYWNTIRQDLIYNSRGFWIDHDGDGGDELVEQQSVAVTGTYVHGQCEPGNCYVGVSVSVRIDGDFLRDPVDLDGDGDVEFAYRGETDDYRDYRTMWADLNGDGLKDAVNINAANDRLEVLINRGLDPDPGLVFVSGDGTEAPGSLLVFSPAGTVLCPNGVCDIDRTPFDFDGDGSEEIQLGQAEPGPAPAQFLDLNGFGKAVIRNDIPGGYHRHEVLGPDLDNDGNPELFAFTLLCNGSEVESEEDCPEPSERSVRIGYRKGPDIARSFLMTGVTDGLGKRTSWRYDTERRIEGYPEEVVKTYTRSEHCTPGSRCQTPCLGAGKVGPLVSEHTETQLNPRAKSETLGPIVQYRYTYKDGRRGNSGRKWFSFAERTIEGPTSKTTIEYINNSLDYDAMRGVTGGEIFKFAGKVKSVTTESILEGRAIYHDDTSVPLVSTVDWAKYRWDLHPNGFPYLMSQYTSYSENDEVLKWTYTGREVDDYGNELSSETTTTVDGRSSTDSVVRTFQNWTGDKWRIGLVDTEVRESSRNAGLPKTRTTAFTYNADGDVMTVAREPEEASSQSGAFQLTTLEYTMRGNIGLICTTDDSSDPCKRFVEVTDWSPGEVFPVVVENALGERLEMAHDARTGQVVWAYDGAGRLVQESEYDAFGRVVFRSTPSSEIEVRYTGSVQWFDESSGGSEGLTGAAQVIVHQVGEGDSSVLLDGRGRVLARRKVGFRSAILQEEMYYDQIGRLIGFSQPHSIAAGAMSQGSTTIDYNGARVVAITGPDGGVTEYSYPSRVTALGSVSEWFDANAGLINGVVTHHPRGNVSAKFVDAFGATALTAQGELGTPDLARVEFGFGPFGVLERVVAPGGTTELGTDVLGRVVSVDDPGAGYRSVTYNGFDEITSVLDGRGELTRFEYDQVGRPSTKKDGNGATIARWIYGAAESPEPGRPVAVFRQDAPGSTTGTWTRYQYQASTETSNRALLARIEYGFNGNVDTVDSGEALAVEFEYGAEVPWRVSTVNYPSSAGEPFSVLYDFDRSSGIMASVRPGDSPSHAFWELEEVEDGMRPKQEGYGDGTVTVLDYFGIEDQGASCGTPDSGGSCFPGAVKGIRTSFGTGATTPLLDLEYAYDRNGNVSRIDDGGTRHEYSYDMLERLVAETRSALADDETGASETETFAYDLAGRILSRTGLGDYEYDAGAPFQLNRAGGMEYTYDAVGNTRSRQGSGIPGGTQFFEYNEFNMPWRISSGQPQGARTQFELAYDGSGSRVSKRETAIAGATERLVRETLEVPGFYERTTEYGEDGVTVAKRIHRYTVMGKGGPIAEVVREEVGEAIDVDATRTVYLHRDQLGSARVVSSVDGLGGVSVETRNYSAFGEVVSEGFQAETSRSSFAGHHNDPEFGLIDMKGRLYDPRIGRFTTADPFVTEPGNAQNWNRYAYVMNNPLSMVDPSGFSGSYMWNGMPYDISPPWIGKPGEDLQLTIPDVQTAHVPRTPAPSPDTQMVRPLAGQDTSTDAEMAASVHGMSAAGAANHQFDPSAAAAQDAANTSSQYYHMEQGPMCVAAAEAGPSIQQPALPAPPTVRPGESSIAPPANGGGDGFSPTLAALGVAQDCPHGTCASPAFGADVQAFGQMKIVDTSGTWETMFAFATAMTPLPEVGLFAGAVKTAGSGIKALLEGLGLGKNAGVRLVKSAEELESLFAQMSAGGKVVEGSSYPGKLIELGDKTTVGIRAVSKSGGPAIDVTLPGGARWKVHIE